MIDFMKWKLTSSDFVKINSTKRRPIITYHVAHHPKHLNIRVLPNEYKQFLSLQFKEFVEWIKENNFNEDVQKQANEIASGVITYMNEESYYTEYWNEFVEYTQKLDSIRNESIFEVEPKFKEYIHEF
jgi:hypothetical protein